MHILQVIITVQLEINSYTIMQKWTAPKTFWCIRMTKLVKIGSSKENCLSVSVLGKQHKLLGVSILENNLKNICGKTVYNEVMGLLQEWNCVNIIRSMVFDTTSYISGPYLDACVTFQKSLGKPIFRLACRHLYYSCYLLKFLVF